MSVTDYQQWLKMGQEMGMEAEELKSFVKERQAELREERAKEREDKKARELLEEERAKRQLEDERAKRQAEEERAKRQMEIDEERAKRQADEERVKRQMEIDEERAKRQAEDERAKRQAEEERAKRQMEIDLELKKIEAEVKLKEIAARATADRQQNGGSNVMFVNDNEEGNSGNNGRGIRDIKFPNFNENKDCLDAYLLRFERTVEAYEIPQRLWSLTLARHLEGKALEVYQRLSSREAQNYECLKEQLLKRFRLTEGGYRQKFRESRIEIGETCGQFFERLRRYLRQWMALAGYEETFEGLESLILKEQFFTTCSPELKIFIREKGKIKLNDMLTHAEAYIEAHGYKHGDTSMRVKPRFTFDRDQHKVFEERTKDKFTNASNRFKAANEWHGETNRSRVNNRDFHKEGTQSNEKGIVCYICKMAGHKAYNCPNKFKGNVKHTAAAIQVFENSRHKIMNSRGRCGVMCGSESDNWRIPQIRNSEASERVTSAFVMDMDCHDLDRSSNVNSQHWVKLNGIESECLYDSGATCCVVKRSLIDNSALTGKETLCTLIDGSTKLFPTANVIIEGEYFTGQIEALVMEDPVKPVIIGKIHGVRYLLGKDKTVEVNLKSDACNRDEVDTEPNTGQNKYSEIHKHTESSREEDIHIDRDVTAMDDVIEECKHRLTMAAVETREASAKVEKFRPLKYAKLPDLKVTPEEIKRLQMEDETLKKYMKIADQTRDVEEQ